MILRECLAVTMNAAPMTKPTRKTKSAPAADDPMVQANWRCRRSLSLAFKVYCVQREAAGLTPHTQQDVIAAAVEEFMRRNPIK
jgi:hypothetical protein